MQTPPFFTDILMHSDDELSAALGVAVVEQETIHEWPLSCVTATQVFVTPDGYRVIDWQRPAVGPPEVDFVALLVGLRLETCRHIEPRRYVHPNVVGVFWFLHLCWAVEAQFDLFPQFRGRLFDRWAIDAITQILQDGG
jgi:hypothetical protein